MRSVKSTLNISGSGVQRRTVLVALISLVILLKHVPPTHSAPHTSSLRDVCGHTLRRPSSFFGRHFDSTFLKHFFKHLIPFTSSARVKMQFYLYKRDFAECGREIITDDHNTLDMSDFNPEHPTRIIIHGWMSQSKGALNRAVKNAYLSLVKRVPQPAGGSLSDASPYEHHTTDSPSAIENDFRNNNKIDIDLDTGYRLNMNATNNDKPTDFNVIVCDWSVIASNVNYYSVVDMVEDLGRLLVDFTNFLHLRTGLNYNDVYLIGHSLGAQIAGSAGKQAFPHRFNTIYALDPAGPKFRDLSDEYRVDPTDADYVESIQTSSSLGFEEPVGHATFYPNYGRDQKKCYFYGCSHRRAYHYFAESITSKLGFWGTLCRRQADDVWIISESGAEFIMGGEPSTPKRGTFYVKTAARPPYALGRSIQPERLVTPAIDFPDNDDIAAKYTLEEVQSV
ncbi:inactive pancreatic lipase-related protein 1 [Ceratitis capitata]|uniref:inactive pancreatic lipase-related protein 1 n=1 Tax=Ceratitis capitata TaxID=7213 RepID=UPI000A102418|nr:inactive pancreatic lipase-related protein 1 [Ceratitis capitata]